MMLTSLLSFVPALALVPMPQSVQPTSGTFTLSPQAAIVAPATLSKEAGFLGDLLRKPTGFLLPVTKAGKAGDLVLRLDTKAGVGPEGYTLSVKPAGVTISAESPAGIFYGIQTFRQLMPVAVERRWQTMAEWTVPGVEIRDSPRFGWRGSHVDVSRHFMPKEFLFKYLDLMALHKLNVFHWHLTDDQGWRIEIKRYPKLTSVGSVRSRSMLKYSPAEFEDKPHGGFYTQEDVREVVAYAKARHIRVVPEIEMPGHAQAAIAAYPELGNTGEQLPVATTWGVINNVFNTEDSTIKFLQNVLEEVMTLFPGEFIHIGGDECPKDQWKASPRVQAKMNALGLKDEHEMQSWFIRQMDQFLDAKGRRLIGWSEILEGGLAPGAALMVWLGDDGALEAVRSGHDVVMAQTSHTYFDYYQAPKATEPHAIGGFLPLEKVYAYEPILPAMTAEQAKHVMGVQYQLWTEYIRTPAHLEYMAFPRACALSEVAWTEKAGRDFGSFQSRLPMHLERLRALDVNFRRP